MVQEELGNGQQCLHARQVPTQPRVQGLQAGEGAVQEGGVLPAEHVQHQQGLHQALWRQWLRLEGACTSPALPTPIPPHLAGTYRFLQVGVALPQGSWGSKRINWFLRQHQNSQTRGALCSAISKRGRWTPQWAEQVPQGRCEAGMDAWWAGFVLSNVQASGAYPGNQGPQGDSCWGSSPHSLSSPGTPVARETTWGLTSAALLDEALAILKGLLPQLLLGR